MRFGKGWEEFKDDATGGDGTNYLRALKEGDTVVQFLTDPDQWVGYLEHFNPTPGGYSFPCTQEDNCPGCNSDSEKMKGRTRKVAFACVVDDKWVNVYRVPKKFAEKIARRQERTGTLKGREYILTRTGKGLDTDYDVETGDKVQVIEAEIPDIEKMLVELYEQSWGDHVFATEKAPQPEAKPAIDENEYSETELRAMTPGALRKLAKANKLEIPESVDDEDPNAIVDWMILASQEGPPF